MKNRKYNFLIHFLSLLEAKHLEDPRKLPLFQTPVIPKKANHLKDFDSTIKFLIPPSMLPSKAETPRTEWEIVRRDGRHR